MPKAHVHLLLPPNQWTNPGYSWCLRFFDATRGHPVPVTDLLTHTTCPRCLALFKEARLSNLHPLRVYSELDTLAKAVTIDNPATVARYCRHLVQERQEVTFCLMATSKFRLIHADELFKGTSEQSLMHPREIFATVMRWNAHCFVLVQNHPSGEIEPTETDLKTVNRMIQCSKLLQIPYHDHVIVARQGFYSLREHTTLWNDG
jgi:DNA repair protein RadC